MSVISLCTSIERPSLDRHVDTLSSLPAPDPSLGGYIEFLPPLTVLRTQVPESLLQLESLQDIERAERLVLSSPEYIGLIDITIDKDTKCNHDEFQALFKAIASNFTGRLDVTFNHSIHSRNDCSSLVNLLNKRR